MRHLAAVRSLLFQPNVENHIRCLPLVLNCPKRTLKSYLKYKWVKPERKPSYDISKSGDCEPIRKFDAYQPAYEFRDVPDLEKCDPSFQKLTSVQFQIHHNRCQTYQQELIDKVKAHEYDKSSPEAIIASQTGRIRYLQPYIAGMKRRDWRKLVELKELVEKRNGRLQRLRETDYQKFEWVLERLNLTFKYYNRDHHLQALTRKRAMTKLADMYTVKLTEEKLAKCKKDFDLQKVPFLETKVEKLKHIMELENKYNLEKTVTEEDLKEVEEKIEKLKVELKDVNIKQYERKIHPWTLEPYIPEPSEIKPPKKLA